MAKFHYQAKDRTGNKSRGMVEADTINAAAQKLRGEGLVIIQLKDAKKGLEIPLLTNRVQLKEKVIFTRELSVMIRAGLPITKALDALERQTDNQYFKEIIRNIQTQVKGGRTLSRALARYPKIFPDIYVAVVKAGEQTGQLAEVLLNLADQQEKEADLISKVKSAMIYPAVIMVALVGVVIIIIFFVLPSLQGIFAQSNQQLPFLTRALLGTSNFVRHYVILVVAILIGLYAIARAWVRRPSGKSFFDLLKIKLPVFGNLTKKLYMARFARTMAMLTKASLPILVSIKIIRKTINNTHYDEAFNRIERAVESGKSISAAIDREPLFPAMVSQLTSLGEESGSLENVFMEIADFYDKEVDTISKNLSTLLEPVMLIIMGIGVGFVVAAVLGPIYGLVQNYGG